MPDLSAYINFSARMDKSGVTPYFVMTDTGTYPGGVAPTLTGIFSITQPDGVTVGGSWLTPDIYYSGGGLVTANKELRLMPNFNFQPGTYSITYTINATGYTETSLTKSFAINYTPSTVAMNETFDIFTPALNLSDATNYASPSGVTYVSTVLSWSVVINSVLGTPHTITGSATTIDLAYGGSYYDSEYVATLTTYPLYTINSWASLKDARAATHTFYAQIPATLATLRIGLDALKATMDSYSNIYQLSATYQERYQQASNLLDDFQRLGCAGDTTNLYGYLVEMLKLFNNNVTPVYTNTNTAITAYNFECTTGGGGSGGVQSGTLFS